MGPFGFCAATQVAMQILLQDVLPDLALLLQFGSNLVTLLVMKC